MAHTELSVSSRLCFAPHSSQHDQGKEATAYVGFPPASGLLKKTSFVFFIVFYSLYLRETSCCMLVSWAPFSPTEEMHLDEGEGGMRMMMKTSWGHGQDATTMWLNMRLQQSLPRRKKKFVCLNTGPWCVRCPYPLNQKKKKIECEFQKRDYFEID